MAQLVEQRTRNAQVIGSNPISSSKKPQFRELNRGYFLYIYAIFRRFDGHLTPIGVFFILIYILVQKIIRHF